MLKKMLEKENIVIFSDESTKFNDGIPMFSIIYDDIKGMSLMEDRLKKEPKNVVKPKVDMGIPH